MNYAKHLPDAHALLALSVQELAVPVLRVVVDYISVRGEVACLNNLANPNNEELQRYAGKDVHRVSAVIGEVWNYLRASGFLAPSWSGDDRQNLVVSRTGTRLLDAASHGQVHHWFSSRALRSLVGDPRLLDLVEPDFVRGDFASVLFKAFREVEIRVRTLGGYGADDLGVALMRDAFKAGAGPLADTGAPRTEQDSLSALFWGSLGAFKNPSSHRDVRLDDESEALELVGLADLLLKIAERHAAKRHAQSSP